VENVLASLAWVVAGGAADGAGEEIGSEGDSRLLDGVLGKEGEAKVEDLFQATPG
jgi:hypothetical protein